MVDLKERLIRRIKETSDVDVLREIYRLLEIDLDELDVYPLSEQQKSIVNESRQEIATGNFLTNEKSNEETEWWLKERPSRPTTNSRLLD